jgi:PKD repeat protein
MRKLLVYAAALPLAAVAACTVHQSDTPNLSGPSSNALSVTVTATPDTLPQDGTSTSRIVIKALNAGGQPYPNLSVRLDMQQSGTTQDFGTLTARTLLTAADGTASTTYTAPAGPSVGGSGSTVAVVATPIASDASSAGILQGVVGALYQVVLHLTPSGTSVPPPTETPTAVLAAANVTPSSPKVGQTVLFNGTSSCASGVSSGACVAAKSTLTSWDWDFGDGTAHGSGSIASHVYSAPGPVAVKLVVTNSQGTVSSPVILVLTVAVGGANPVAIFTSSVSSNTATLDGSRSTGNVVNYFWNFGDGTTSGSTNPIVTHTYATSGTKAVTLTVTDVNGNSASQANNVVIP